MAKPKGRPMRSHRIYFFLDEEEIGREYKKKLEEEEKALRKGIHNEDLIEEALQTLRLEGEVYHFYRSKRGGELNHNLKVDFLVWVQPGQSPDPLQVKSSEANRQKHLQKYGDRIPYCVVVEPSDTPDSLTGKILRELGLDTKPLEEYLESVLLEMQAGVVATAGPQ